MSVLMAAGFRALALVAIFAGHRVDVVLARGVTVGGVHLLDVDAAV